MSESNKKLLIELLLKLASTTTDFVLANIDRIDFESNSPKKKLEARKTFASLQEVFKKMEENQNVI